MEVAPINAEQIVQKFWASIQKAKEQPVSVEIDGVNLSAIIRSHDALSCVLEQLTIIWLPKEEIWTELVTKCISALSNLQHGFTLVEQDDERYLALLRSPVGRHGYWEANLRREQKVSFTIRRFQPLNHHRRITSNFLLTSEQLADLLSDLLV